MCKIQDSPLSLIVIKNLIEMVEINEAERKKEKKNQKKGGQPQGPLG